MSMDFYDARFLDGYDDEIPDPPCPHDWTLRPESDTSVCETCGAETTGDLA